MTLLFGDYSSGRPSGASLKAGGIAGVIRYVGLGSSGKRITAAEYQDLVANGIFVLLVAELNTHDAEGGRTAGQNNARAALADARALGIPDTVPIAAAADEHLTSAQVSVALDYVRGFIDVLGNERVGTYGFAELVDASHAAGLGSWWWKCGSAPTTAEAPWVTFWQRNSGTTTMRIANTTVDIDQEYNPLASFGDDMATTDVVYTDQTGNTRTVGQILQFLDQWIRFGGPAAIGKNGMSANDVLSELPVIYTALFGSATPNLNDAIQNTATAVAALEARPAVTVDQDALTAALTAALAANPPSAGATPDEVAAAVLVALKANVPTVTVSYPEASA